MAAEAVDQSEQGEPRYFKGRRRRPNITDRFEAFNKDTVPESSHSRRNAAALLIAFVLERTSSLT